MKLSKLNNTRDLGGFPADGGRKIKYGRLIRSGRLYKIPKSTVKAIKDLGVTTIIDLRIEQERKEYPCVHIEGAKQVNLPLACTATVGITHTKSMARTMFAESRRIGEEFKDADEYMKSVYDIILSSEYTCGILKEFFALVKADEHCILWHCNAGKDRTGITAMLLEAVLGVDEELIIADYCATKSFQSMMRFWQKAGLAIVPMSRRFKHILIALMEAKPQYIIGAMETLKKKYGSVLGYCQQVLELTDQDVEFLRNKYLE